MTTKEELKSAIENLLRIPSVLSLLHLNSDTIERAYEYYILGLCAEAVRGAGGQATLKGIVSGDNPRVVIFRGGPGYMSSNVQDFCYVSCNLNGKQFESNLNYSSNFTLNYTNFYPNQFILLIFPGNHYLTTLLKKPE